MLSSVSARPAFLRQVAIRFVEETAEAERIRLTAPVERDVAGEVGRWLMAQCAAVLPALERAIGAQMDAEARQEESAVRAGLTEAIRPAEWDYVIAQVMRRPYGGAAQLGDILEGAHRRGYIAGSNVTRAQLGGKNPAFWLGNDDAVAWSRARAAARVTGIDETTRAELNRIISGAVEKRLTWRETAALIEERYADMAGPPLFPSRTHRRRAQMIAAYETRDAYEAGGMAQAQRLAESGGVVEKRWAYLRDGRARDTHRANGDAGWVPLDHIYEDNTERPPSDGNCRCVLLYRFREGSAPPDDAPVVIVPGPDGLPVVVPAPTAAARPSGDLSKVLTLAGLAMVISALLGGDGE